MHSAAAHLCSSILFSRSRSTRTPRPTVRGRSGRCMRWSSIRATGWLPSCWSGRPQACCSGVTASSTSSIFFPMRIARAELFDLTLPLVEPFVISGGTISERRSLIVVLHDDTGHVGYGGGPPFELPFYSEETVAGARALIERVLLPRVTCRDFDGPLPEAVDAALRDGVRGNWFARAAVETAAWDLEAYTRGVGLASLLGERLAVKPASAVDCGVALGIPPERRAEVLTKWVYEAVQRGYRRVKIKVAPGWDIAAVAAARGGMVGTTLPLTVDANGAYEWPRDETALRALDDAGLLYIEQPLHPDELVGHARLAGPLRTPVCLDETLRDARAARQVMALDGPKVWNIKGHRVA